ncbi:adenylate kinase [Tanacetum coccineum]|uniref:Adenylate kinase n=1 Tax=Tanacetum coccineum TaxID=301880 RepID=A0ABQ5EVK7_9ASTR
MQIRNASKLASQFNKSPATKDNWRGIPTNLNNIPHSREIREYFYDDVLQATQRAINDGKIRVKVEINIPELNPEQDVYRIGTLMELVRVLALSFADDGKRVKVCVQGSMGEGALAGMPLQLAGTRQILEYMDWGSDGAMGNFINIGAIGGKEVDEVDDIFILVAPQNAMGNCIIDAMTDAAGSRPVIVINPRLKDLPASSGIMQDGLSISANGDEIKMHVEEKTEIKLRRLQDSGAHDKEGTRADVSAPGWSANDWLAPEGTKILLADQSEADTSAYVSPYHPFIFDIDGHTFEYGREDFCLITGFRFDKLNLDPDEEYHSEFRMRVFPKIENLKGEHLLELVNKDVKFAKFDDEDVVRVCLLLALDFVFMVMSLDM